MSVVLKVCVCDCTLG